MNKIVLNLTLASSLAFSLNAMAGSKDWNEGWYVGGGINGVSPLTQKNQFSFSNPSFSVSVTSELDSSDVGFDLYLGKKINKNWAAELGFTQVGDLYFTGSEFVSQEAGDYSVFSEQEVKQYNVHLVGLYTLSVADSFNVFGKFGAAYLGSSEELTLAVAGEPPFEPADGLSEKNELGTFALTYGFGAEVVWDRWGVRAEYNVIQPAADINQEDFWTDTFYVADVISLNGYYRFGY